MKRLIKVLMRIYTKSPFYPHWYEFHTADKLFKRFLREVNVRLKNLNNLTLVELGCSSQSRKETLVKNLPIKHYYGLDYPAWLGNNMDSFFEIANKFGSVKEILFGGEMKLNTDIWGDAHHLPFANESVDIMFHSGVIEHLSNYDQVFSETSRCLSNEGVLIFVAPFLYQDHSSYDISRLTRQGMREVCNKHGLQEFCVFGTGVGPTISQLLNSFYIRHIAGLYSGNFVRIVLFGIIGSLFYFPLANIVGATLDKINTDQSFANRYYFCFQKKTSNETPGD